MMRSKTKKTVQRSANSLTPTLSKLLTSSYRKNLWKNTKQIIRALKRQLPITEVYVLGSFTTAKRRPADVDLIILLKTPKRGRDAKWAVDMVLTTDSPHGKWVLDDARKWMSQKYGKKGSAVIRMK